MNIAKPRVTFVKRGSDLAKVLAVGTVRSARGAVLCQTTRMEMMEQTLPLQRLRENAIGKSVGGGSGVSANSFHPLVQKIAALNPDQIQMLMELRSKTTSFMVS